MSDFLCRCSDRLDEAAGIIAYVNSTFGSIPQEMGRLGPEAEHGLYLVLYEAERRIRTVSKRIYKASKGGKYVAF